MMRRPQELWSHINSVFKSKFCPSLGRQPWKNLHKSLSFNLKAPRPFNIFSLVKECRVLGEDIGKHRAHDKGSWLLVSVLNMEVSGNTSCKQDRKNEWVLQ